MTRRLSAPRLTVPRLSAPVLLPAFVLVLLVLGPAPTAHAAEADALPPSVTDAIGVNIHFTGAPARDLDMIRDAGFGWVRMDFVWQSVEREKGRYRFGPYDELVEGLSSRGIRALFILDYSNPLWEADRSVRTEEGRKAFARFAAAAAARYRGKGIRWEIWNEPNLEGFWKPQPAADDYAALAIETAKAMRAVDPEATILAPASSGFPWAFLERIFELGVLGHIDEVSVHPYRASAPETALEDYARLRGLIARHLPPGRRAPPIVSGEWGYSTWHHGGKPFSEEVQAAYLLRQLLTNIAEGIPLSIWYDWANDGPDPRETEHNFGTVTLDRRPKPAYIAAKTMTSLLGRARFERRIRAGAEDHILLFRRGAHRNADGGDRGARDSGGGEGPVLAAWTTGRDRLLALDVLARNGSGPGGSVPDGFRPEGSGLDGSVKGVGMGGETVTLKADGGLLRLPLDGKPLYVELPPGVRSIGAWGLEAEPHAKGIRVRVLRSGSGTVPATLDVLLGGERVARDLAVEGDASRAVDLPVAWPRGKPLRVAASLRDASGRELAALPAMEVIDLDAFGDPSGDPPSAEQPLAGHLAAILDGDAGVDAEASLASVAVAEGEPFSGAAALRLDYRFAKGWRFVRVAPARPGAADRAERPVPAERGARPEGRSGSSSGEILGAEIPGPATYSVWVKGDGSGNVLRARVRDAKGETFQPAGLPVSWKGWRRVEMPLDGSEAGSWGGDGKVDWPIRWDTLILVDSTRDGGEGSMELSGAMLIRRP